MFKRILPVTLIAGLALFIVSAAIADVPPPPANQNIGIDDGVFTGLERADCLAVGCHIEDTINDRHHLLYNSGIPSLSVVPYPGLVTNAGTTDERYNCQGCHTNAQPPVVETECLNCHGFYRGDPNDPAASPHHGTAEANDGNCQACHGDLVNNIIGTCSITIAQVCNVDGDCPTGETCNYPHYIPTYDPSLVTPTPSQGDAWQTNAYDNGAGACNFCHDSDTAPGGPGTGVVIYSNRDTHHGTNLINFGLRCDWCHYMGNTPPSPIPEPTLECSVTTTTSCLVDADCPTGETCDNDWYYDTNDPFAIRGCEQCHGPDSLHNIQTDSNGDDIIDIGGELAGYGHVGRDQGPDDSDCWGCHGFAGIAGEAPGSGPVIPSVGGADVSRTTAGTATTVTLTGAAFTNIDGATSYVSGATLTAADGSVTTLETSNVSEGSMSAMIPAGQAPGNYDLQVVKAGSASNPAVVSITPVADVTGETCTDGTTTISGSGFFAEGGSVTGTIVTGKGKRKVTTTETGAVSSWSDTQIVATFSACPQSVDVTTVFAGGGDPPAESCADITDGQICIDDPACDWNCNKKGRCSCSDGGGDPPTGSCSDNTDQGSCETAGCNWNQKKSVCR